VLADFLKSFDWVLFFSPQAVEKKLIKMTLYEQLCSFERPYEAFERNLEMEPARRAYG